MAKKIFLICLMLLLSMQSAAAAKKDVGLPMEQRIKIAVEVTDSSRYKELPTAYQLEMFLNNELVKKNLLNVVGMKNSDDNTFVGTAIDAKNIGEILVFNVVEMPPTNEVAVDFNPEIYQPLGANYIIRCEVLGLGVTKVEDRTVGIISGAIGTGLSFIGHGKSSRDETLRGVGTIIGLGSWLDMRRTALNTVVNMKFINAETGAIIWQENFIGYALKHHNPSKGYSDVWEQAYVESLEESAKIIAKKINKYVDSVIIQGKSDKSFTEKKSSFRGIALGF